MDVGKNFVILATLPILSTPTSSSELYSSNNISLALRNRFVTICVESPDLTVVKTRKEIAASVLSRMTNEKIQAAIVAGDKKGIFNPDIPSTLYTRTLNPELINDFSDAIAEIKVPPCTVRDIASLATAVGWAYGSINWKDPKELMKACMLDEEWLASDDADTLVLHTVGYNKPGERFFFNTHDRHSPMWQIIAALSVASASSQHIFLQV
jgi:hypothetical protein